MCFIKKTDCKQSLSNGGVNQFPQHLQNKKRLPTYCTLGFAADSSCCSWMISNLL